MKNAKVYAKRFATLMRRIKAKHPAQPTEPAEPVAQLVIAFLEWNASRSAARAAYDRLLAKMVDHNELRVSHAHEIVAILGKQYPKVQERSERLHDTLHDIFMREQAVNLGELTKKGKKEIRQYLGSLKGITPYVAAQVTLRCFGGHAVPVDDRLADLLAAVDAVDSEASIGDIESFLERQIKADGAIEAHEALMTWRDAGSGRVTLNGLTGRTKKKRATVQNTKKKTNKKKTKAKIKTKLKTKAKTKTKKKTKR